MRRALSDNDTSASRIRVRYAKTGKPRFISAIDLGRVWERALRRADLPIAYSEGFSPHPKVSFPDALALGIGSTGEYAELTFAVPVLVGPAMEALNATLPEGIEILTAVPLADGDPRLSKWLTASCWELEYPEAVAPDDLAARVAAVLAADEVLVGRERKGETAEIDLRPALHLLSSDGRRVRAVLHHTDVALRPAELHLALAGVAPGLDEPTLVLRVAQGGPVPGGLEEALSGELVPVGDPEFSLSKGQRP